MYSMRGDGVDADLGPARPLEHQAQPAFRDVSLDHERRNDD
jgi:hypothetical protein